MRSVFPSAALLTGVGFAALFATTVHAGTICGTVRNGITGLPVARAGVFVRLPVGSYTGFHGATDGSGRSASAESRPAPTTWKSAWTTT